MCVCMCAHVGECVCVCVCARAHVGECVKFVCVCARLSVHLLILNLPVTNEDAEMNVSQMWGKRVEIGEGEAGLQL
jgi:hypothetical protein